MLELRRTVALIVLATAGCGGNSGQLVADRGFHSAMAVSDGYPVWIRDTDFSGAPGAVNRLTIDTRAVTPLVRQGSLWSQDDTDLALATSGGVVYFTTTTSVMSVAVTGGDATVIVDESQHGRPLFVAADSDHVYWTRWSGGIVAQSLADGSQTMISSTSTAEGLAVDDTNVYWYDWQGLWRTPKAGGAVALLAPEPLPNSHLQITGGFVYWLAFDGVKRIPVAGGVASAHGLRYFFNDELRRAGVDEVTHMALTGHVTKKMRQHYSTVGVDEKRAAVDAVAKRLADVKPGTQPGTPAKNTKAA